MATLNEARAWLVGRIAAKTDRDIMAHATVHHEGEIEVDVYWEHGELRVKIDSEAFADILSPIVAPLADPTKPVRIRLTMQAERIEEPE